MIREPIFFERNRVWRVYTGGKLFEGLWGDFDFVPAPDTKLVPQVIQEEAGVTVVAYGILGV